MTSTEIDRIIERDYHRVRAVTTIYGLFDCLYSCEVEIDGKLRAYSFIIKRLLPKYQPGDEFLVRPHTGWFGMWSAQSEGIDFFDVDYFQDVREESMHRECFIFVN